MKTFLTALLLLVAPPLAAQTTGVTWRNDYIVDGLGSGEASCQLLLLDGGPTQFTVSARSGGLGVFMLFSPGPCAPGVGCVDASPCGIPATGCKGTTNQSLDLLTGGLLPIFAGTTGGSGTYSTIINLPPGAAFSTQAIVVDTLCGSATFDPPILFSQAYTIIT